MWSFIPRRRPTTPRLDDAVWSRTLASLRFLRSRPESELHRLRSMAGEFVARKAITGAAGFEPDDLVCASIATQACVPVLNLGLHWYRDFVEVIVYPGAFVAERSHTDEAGIVHEWTDELAGESMDGGPVVLSWDDVQRAAQVPGYNVVIHEFAHKLDLVDGVADGCPPMPLSQGRSWRATLNDAYERFVSQLEAAERAIPRHVDPEGPEADQFYSGLPLDAYAATDPSEFFAVASESFFVENERFRAAFPELDAAMRLFYRQNP